MANFRMNRFYYRPLPKNLKICNSEIEGHGIFANCDIKKGTDLGSTHIKCQHGGYVRTPLGGFVNHSLQNNCELFVKEDWDDYLVYNIRSIKNKKRRRNIVKLRNVLKDQKFKNNCRSTDKQKKFVEILVENWGHISKSDALKKAGILIMDLKVQ